MSMSGPYRLFIYGWVMLALSSGMHSCESRQGGEPAPDDSFDLTGYPDFITPADQYFDLSLGAKPNIDANEYRLKISGAVGSPASFSLEELSSLEMFEQTLTIECIHNPPNGNLLGTATWQGFRLYDLLQGLGIGEGASFVKYISADGYFTYNTIEELKTGNVLGALYMNGEPIPRKFGFPLRILFPGYYGVRQPGWVTEIALLDSGIKDYWGEAQFQNWHTDSAMTVDSKIFFPSNRDTVALGEKLTIGGTAYGDRRISAVEITPDDGQTWIPAVKVREKDMDHVWVFWEAEYTPQTPGNLSFRARATGLDGRVQQRDDFTVLDGTNSWPRITVFVQD